jgi:Flp pilus assembly protein TadD
MDTPSQHAFEHALQLHRQGRLAEAEQSLRRAIAITPDAAELYNSLGAVLAAAGKTQEAIAAYHQALARKPGYAEAENNLGCIYLGQGMVDKAIASFTRAVNLMGNHPAFACNLGNALQRNGQLEESAAALRRAIAIVPSMATAHAYLGMVLLAMGDYPGGWEEYEWRWAAGDFTTEPRKFAQPRWQGEPLNGRMILLHAEQGLGDTIQFARFVPMVIERGGNAVLECQPELVRLLDSSRFGCKVIAKGQSLPTFDLHCPLLSLPRVLGTTVQNVPAIVPYLKALSDDESRWRGQLSGRGNGFKVGLAWAGGPGFSSAQARSLTLGQLIPVLQTPSVRFISLQKGEGAEDLTRLPSDIKIEDFTGQLNDFADTAGLIASLDLVISVDTAVAHLAGALGRPVWTLLPSWPDWRWMRQREDSPWYPTMRLFRQKEPGNWNEVIGRVRGELAAADVT